MSGFPTEVLDPQEYEEPERDGDEGQEEAPPLSPREQVIADMRAKKAGGDNDNHVLANDNDGANEDPDDADIVERTEQDLVTLRVDHRDVQVTPEQMHAYARQHLAAENRLSELNALKQQTAAQLAEIQQLKDNLGVRADSTSPQRANAPNAKTDRETPPKARGDLRELAEKIQLGDADEGAEALSQILDAVQSNRGPSAEEMAERILAMSEEREAHRVAGETFAAEHREIASDPVLYGATINRLHERVLEDMQKIGVRPEHLQQAAANFETAAAYHKDLRGQGYALADPMTLVGEAAREIEDRYVAPRQTRHQPSEDRYDDRRAAKRELSGSQPRRVSVVDRQSGTPERRTPGSIVDQYRRARGHVS